MNSMKQGVKGIVYCFIISALVGSGFFTLGPGDTLAESSNSQPQSYVVKLKSSDKLYRLANISPDELPELLNNNAIEFIEPNVTYRAQLLPNDPEYFRQWYMSHISVPAAWEYSTGSNEVVVAVLDTGVDVDHPDLSTNIWINRGEKPHDKIDNDRNGFVDDFYGWNFVNNDNSVKPILTPDKGAVNHGTIVAGVIGARSNNSRGVAGVNWDVKVMALKVLGTNGEGDTVTVANAINYAVDQGADIINLSFNGDAFSSALNNAIQRAVDNDVVVVAAAGNEDPEGRDLDDKPAYPICNDGHSNNVIGVAAVDSGNSLLPFSNYGSKCIDVVAPGANFFSTVVNESHDPNYGAQYEGGWSGTSVAAPVVSGVAALIKAYNPNLKATQIRNIILNTTIDIDRYNETDVKTKLGNGIVDAGLALKATAATLGNTDRVSARQEFLIFGPGETGGPHVRVLDVNGNVLAQWFAYDTDFRGGVYVASGDIDGDGVTEVITGPGPGSEPRVRVFDINGNLRYEWNAYVSHFRGGVYVASGDIDGDGKDEVITGPGVGGGPHVRVFDGTGIPKSQFMAYAPHFRGGVTVSVGDVANSPEVEIITGVGVGGGPHVRAFTLEGVIVSEFMAYAPHFRGGVYVASGDIDGDGEDEIVTTPAAQGGPHVRIFSPQGHIKAQWFAGDQQYRGSTFLGVGDLNGSGIDQLVVGFGAGNNPQVNTYDWLGNKQSSLFAYHQAFQGGVHIGILK